MNIHRIQIARVNCKTIRYHQHMRGLLVSLFVIAALACGCTKRTNYCEKDSDCKNPAFSFCDVNGEYPASGGYTNDCIATPANCPLDRCPCTPGAPVFCSMDQLNVCAPDGHSTVQQTCPLGCIQTVQSQARCLSFDPTNGLGPALADAANEPDVVLPPGARIDTSTGLVQDAGGATLSVKSVLVNQDGGASPIRVLEGKSFIMDDVVVSGSNALALTAPGSISIRGRLALSAATDIAGPGSLEPPAPCAGQDSQNMPFGCNINPACSSALGAGGGGNATPGAAGGATSGPVQAGGAAIPTFAPLVGGCRGGRLRQSDGVTIARNGGGGGGAVQLVSSTLIELTSAGQISAGGGGGPSSTGGGSGGTIILEAPRVRLDGAGTGIFANGGGGGACFMNGPDAKLSFATAQGPQCSPRSGGNGATANSLPTNGEYCAGTCSAGFEGGGGGAVGRLRVATKDGTYETIGSPGISATVSTSTLAPH